MSIKVGINGWGRIGRLVFRLLEENENFEVVAINGTRANDMSAYLLKYDTIHGPFDGEIEADEENFIVNGRNIPFTRERKPEDIPWKDFGVEYVVEATGKFTDSTSSKGHLQAGASKVIVTAPGSDDIPMIVYGTNEDELTGDEDIVSTGSCTTNCLAPMADVLNREYGIQKGLITTIHAYTSDQKLLDGSHSKFTRARAAASNIIPTSTGAARSIGKVIPEIEGKLDGVAQRVPVNDGSLTELTVVLDKETSIDDINKVMKENQTESFAYNEDPIVSSDIVGHKAGSIFDATQTTVLNTEDGQLVRTVAWYDNETGFCAQLVRVMNQMRILQ